MEDAIRTPLVELEARAAKCPVSNCQIPVDIVFRSSDNHPIGAHKANLAQFSAGFPSPDDVTHSDSEVVDLAERSDVLSLLMQFLHNHKFPTLIDITPDDIFELADASEKYMVHAAMNACAIHMKEIAKHPQYSIRSLVYAITNDYPEVADKAAPRTLGCGLGTMREAFKGNDSALLAWVTFREQYLALIEHTLKPPTDRGHFSECALVTSMFQTLREKLQLPGCPYDTLAVIGKDRDDRLLDVNVYLPMLEMCSKPNRCRSQARKWFLEVHLGLRPLSAFR